MNSLRVRIKPDTDGTCELFAAVSVAAFSGAGSAWFGLAQVAQFGHELAESYPLRSGEDKVLEGGYWSSGPDSVLEQCHVRLRFYPVGELGRLGCRVELASPVQSDIRPSSQARVGVELLTEYEAVRRFGVALVGLTEQSGTEAILEET